MKFILRVIDFDDSGKVFEADLNLSEDDDYEKAKSRFLDALYAFKHGLAEREGRDLINCGRIGGRPTASETAAYNQIISEPWYQAHVAGIE